MTMFKCKMCGGKLEIAEEISVCECEYCGSKQTVSTIDDEKIVKLYDRANRFRMANEFDKAAGVYESIIEENYSEAEAYWGLLLCKYGIEYVDDPATGDKIPTCHRSSFDSIMEDSDFESVMDYSDTLSRGVYREQAKQIEEIRKGIIEVSAKEEPYDIFICYKETAEDGDRTIDSVMAQDVYDALRDKGYRVFFSRISLEDKLGMEYESYIFAALNSAKVMLVFGTSYDYYNAVWVKNEWSRYLKIMAKDKSKYLIPCYKDIDAYDIPKEFAKLQAQNMGKVGAVQDLVRGIEKILPRNSGVQIQTGTSANGTEALLKRIEIFLEDMNFDSASEYCEKVLDVEPENAQAYIYKLLIDLELTSIEGLKRTEKDYTENSNYTRALRYASPDVKSKLLEYTDDKLKYFNELEKSRAYTEALDELNKCNELFDNLELNYEGYKELSKKYLALSVIFDGFSEYEDSIAYARYCADRANDIIDNAEKYIEKAEYNKKYTAAKSSYEKAMGFYEKNNIASMEKAIKYFEESADFFDVSEKIAECKMHKENLQSSIGKLAREHEEEIRKREKQELMNKYETAKQVYANANSKESLWNARGLFNKLADYEDSKNYVKKIDLEIEKINFLDEKKEKRIFKLKLVGIILLIIVIYAYIVIFLNKYDEELDETASEANTYGEQFLEEDILFASDVDNEDVYQYIN